MPSSARPVSGRRLNRLRGALIAGLSLAGACAQAADFKASDGNVTTIAAAPDLSGGMVVDATGTVYRLSNGLYSVTPAGVATLLVPAGDDLVLGNVSPVIGRAIDGLGLYDARQLVLFTIKGEGVLVTLA